MAGWKINPQTEYNTILDERKKRKKGERTNYYHQQPVGIQSKSKKNNKKHSLSQSLTAKEKIDCLWYKTLQNRREWKDKKQAEDSLWVSFVIFLGDPCWEEKHP